MTVPLNFIRFFMMSERGIHWISPWTIISKAGVSNWSSSENAVVCEKFRKFLLFLKPTLLEIMKNDSILVDKVFELCLNIQVNYVVHARDFN